MTRNLVHAASTNGWFIVLTVLVLGVRLCSGAAAEPVRFQSRELVQPFDDVLICDVDGNGLDDIVLVVKDKLLVHLHRAAEGISATPDLEYVCSDGPAVVWSARTGPSNKACLLMMTAQGVWALTYTPGQLTKTPLIDCRTILPEKAQQDGVPIVLSRLSAGTRQGQAVIFVPTDEGGGLRYGASRASNGAEPMLWRPWRGRPNCQSTALTWRGRR